MNTGWLLLLLLVVVVSSHNVDSQSTTDDDTCSDGGGLVTAVSELKTDLELLLDNQRTTLNELRNGKS